MTPALSHALPVHTRLQRGGLAAVERHGLAVGGRLTAARLRRCRPGVVFGPPDPVP